MKAYKTYLRGNQIPASPYRKVFASAKAFVEIAENEKEKIKKVNFIPPKVGSKSFGKFYLELD